MQVWEVNKFDRQAVNGFVEIPQASGIMINQLTQMKEAMPSDKDNGQEQEVIMHSMMWGGADDKE